jgi:multidrug efflux pump
MAEITPTIIGITLVLSAVFIPMVFASGSVGTIYRQFAVAMSVSILLSAFLALTLTPALCATLLKPVDRERPKHRFFRAFDRWFDRTSTAYETWVGRLLKQTGRMMAIFVLLAGLMGIGFVNLPSSFLPEEDQGYYMTTFQLPADATASRTMEAVSAFERFAATRPGVLTTQAILGFGFPGSGALHDAQARGRCPRGDRCGGRSHGQGGARRHGHEHDAACHRGTWHFVRVHAAPGGSRGQGARRAGSCA